MKTTVQTSRGPVRFHSVGQPIAGIPASQPATTQHTPGPWFVHPEFGTVTNADSSICDPTEAFRDGKYMPIDERAANARLIAAAPDLLAALEATAKALQSAMDRLESARMRGDAATYATTYHEARAAILRAKGQA